MTEEELERLTRLVIRNVLRLENIARDIARGASKDLQGVYRTILQQLLDLPPGGIEREMAYQALEEMMRAQFEPPAVRLQSDIARALGDEAPEQVAWASRYVQLQDIVQPSVMRQMAVNAVGDVRVLNKSVMEMARPLSKSQWRRVDNAVREGYLRGETNAQVAKRVSAMYKRSVSEMRALTRTATMSLAQEAHNQFWDANADVIVAWRWDASMDYRVCPICAPLDGVEHSKRKAFKTQPPAHPNCRCHIVPVTELMREVEGEDEGERSIQELVKDKPQEGPGVRVYKQKVRGKDGKMYWRKVTDVPSEDGKAMTMGGFLRRANNVTQESVLGKARAKRFRELIKGTPGSRAPLSAEEALVVVTKA